MSVAGSRFSACTIEGNLAGSLIRNTGCEAFISHLRQITPGASYRAEEDPIKIALLGIELKGEASVVPNTVRRASLTSYRREASKQWSLLADLVEKSSTC